MHFDIYIYIFTQYGVTGLAGAFTQWTPFVSTSLKLGLFSYRLIG